MKYQEVAEALYSKNRNEIRHIINHSLEAKHFEQKISSMVIHTGFIFTSKNDIQSVLLYDLSTEQVIRQSNNEHLPQLNGLLVIKVNTGNFNIPIPLFFSHIKNNNEVYRYHHVEINRKLEADCITIYDKDTIIAIRSITLLDGHLGTLKEYPLRETLRLHSR
ncbi:MULTISPECIES: hypothetical protein [Olivibacter]|jgi:uncharacterized FlaG/YvyC family protein|uniref:Uncharacterized protein n=2 Tax=Olivibacter TaxID=376469 RepID=A0ABV6HSK3_9SPHI|nr:MULTISPECIES: hypothetical protein [Olivibacter]MCL4639268.1 hypothetical protein [Olivibacter sp. UJ_SKK_5.1]MDM8174436.1 hypothetical protein [Olivibacter sp. 47]MDX3916690.1 hypothetical protein [Pseudosphingobacterium sp.]QEL01308.1 hypothetical protein FKG96_10955 [Olivibacter sp. LS-1]